MQVKTQLIIEDILTWIVVIAFVGVWLWLSSMPYDNDIDTDFPTKPTIEVHIKQGMNQVVYRECVLLGDRVEC